MKATAEISLYPLNANYIPPISEFIERLNKHKGLTIITNATSTQISGDYKLVMDVLKQEVGTTFSQNEKFVVVVKLINAELLQP
jgi:uncharacterized protein YqgV (UPF0045/DUF77 family)